MWETPGHPGDPGSAAGVISVRVIGAGSRGRSVSTPGDVVRLVAAPDAACVCDPHVRRRQMHVDRPAHIGHRETDSVRV